MSFLLSLLFMLTCQTQGNASDDGSPVLFARTIVERPSLPCGDSTLVSIVLYSDGGFVDVRQTGGKDFKAGGIRKLNLPRRRALGSAVWQGRRYNTLVWAQYVVASDKRKTIKIPRLKFSATLRYTLRTLSPFGLLQGGRQKDVAAKCKSEAATVTFTDKPKQTTKTLIQTNPFAL